MYRKTTTINNPFTKHKLKSCNIFMTLVHINIDNTHQHEQQTRRYTHRLSPHSQKVSKMLYMTLTVHISNKNKIYQSINVKSLALLKKARQ